MDRNTVHLYEILGVPKTSTQDEIKKAYRRLALRYHPDKVNTAEVPDHETRFRDIAGAYEVLGDPKTRQVYDKYGMMGVQMLNTPMGGMIGPEMEGLLCTFFILIALLVILAILFFSFLAVRVDGKVSWSYAIVFIPLWILDVIIFLVILYQLSMPIEDEPEEDQDEENNSNNGDTSPMAQEQQKAEKRKQRKQARTISSVFSLLNVLLFTAFEVLIVKKANDSDSITAAVMFAPYFALEALYLILTIVPLSAAMVAMRQQPDIKTSAKLQVVFEALWWKFIRIALAVLIMLKIDGSIDCSWAIVFIPSYLVGIKYFIQLIFQRRKFSKLPDDFREQGYALVTAGFIALFVIGALCYTLIGLLVARLDGNEGIKLSNVLIPIFIVLSLLLCCSGCFLPCLLMSVGAMDESGAGMNGEEGGPEIRVVSPNMRIEDGSRNDGTNGGEGSSSTPNGSRRFGRFSRKS